MLHMPKTITSYSHYTPINSLIPGLKMKIIIETKHCLLLNQNLTWQTYQKYYSKLSFCFVSLKWVQSNFYVDEQMLFSGGWIQKIIQGGAQSWGVRVIYECRKKLQFRLNAHMCPIFVFHMAWVDLKGEQGDRESKFGGTMGEKSTQGRISEIVIGGMPPGTDTSKTIAGGKRNKLKYIVLDLILFHNTLYTKCFYSLMHLK